MTASKKPTSISRHKTGTTRQVAAAKASTSPQAFDIIPRSQVKPSTTSRPVITSSQPEVADNTLTQPNPAPQLQLQHKRVELKPSPEATAAKDETAPAAMTEERGVSVAELLAKRAENDKPAQPAAAATDQEQPQPTKAEQQETAKPNDEPKADAKTPEAAEAADEPQSEPEPESKSEPNTSEKPAEDDDSLAQALKEDAEAPQQHSESLKEAIKDLDGEHEARPHHELFGGKPVIVVHKDHHTSGLMWFVWFIVCLILAVVIVNFLLDAKVITTTYDVPYTDILQ